MAEPEEDRVGTRVLIDGGPSVVSRTTTFVSSVSHALQPPNWLLITTRLNPSGVNGRDDAVAPLGPHRVARKPVVPAHPAVRVVRRPQRSGR